MFNYDTLVTEALRDPDQVWSDIDSFWRSETTVDTHDLVRYQTWASTLLLLDAHTKASHYLSTQTVPAMTEYWRIPWFPLVLFSDRLEEYDAVEYGSGPDYSAVPEIVYGEGTGAPVYRYRLPTELEFITSIPVLVDGVTDTQVVIDRTQFVYTPDTGVLEFSVDPTTLVTPKTSADGRSYIVLWARNAEVDLNVPADQVGWVVRYDKSGRDRYVPTLKHIWDMVLHGPSIARYTAGLSATLDLPCAADTEQVLRIDNDGYQWAVSTANNTYTVLASRASPAVSEGDILSPGQPISDGVSFMGYDEIVSASPSTLSGLSLDVPLSTGRNATLSFANVDTDWTYDAGRPSPWRFPVGGDAADVEQFWTDVDAYAVANSIDFATLYGLPDTVNPMVRVVTDLIHNNVFVASFELEPLDNLQSFAGRARLLMPPGTYLVLHQVLPPADDSLDLGVATSETVGYGYNAAAPTETVSVSGTDLTLSDLTPLVLCT